jgi:hypothetical protein
MHLDLIDEETAALTQELQPPSTASSVCLWARSGELVLVAVLLSIAWSATSNSAFLQRGCEPDLRMKAKVLVLASVGPRMSPMGLWVDYL